MTKIFESKFANDVALNVPSREVLEDVVKEFVNLAKQWGLTGSLEKTMLLPIGKKLETRDTLPIKAG